MKDIFAFKVIVWHRDQVQGTHQSILCSGPTEKAVRRDFDKKMSAPTWMRSFTERHTIQLHGPSGLVATLQ
jgi:hypothetical protein